MKYQTTKKYEINKNMYCRENDYYPPFQNNMCLSVEPAHCNLVNWFTREAHISLKRSSTDTVRADTVRADVRT